MSIRILLVDDHTLFRSGMRLILQRNPEFEIVGEAADGLEGVKRAKQLRPDVVLMDLNMPGLSGLEALQLIIEDVPSTAVLMLTVSEEAEDLSAALRNGARGYLLKNVEAEYLNSAIKKAVAGDPVIAESMTAKLVMQFRSGHNQVTSSDREKLTPRERETMVCIYRGESNKEIARHLDVAESTVKIHVQNILKKLNLTSRVQIAVYAVEHGIADGAGERIAAIGRAMRAGDHGFGYLALGKAGAEREAPANALGHGHDVGGDAGPLIGKEAPGAAITALHLVEDEDHVMPVAEFAQAAQELDGHGGDATLALHRFDQDAASLRPDQRLDGGQIAGSEVPEAGQRRAEAFKIARIATGRDGAHGAAMEGAGEGDDLEAIRLALGVEVMAGRLDGTLNRLGARIGEKDAVGESRLDQPLTQPFLLGNGKDVGRVPDLFRRALERADQMRVAMPEGIDGDTGMEIEIGSAVLREKAYAFPPLKGEFGPGVGAVKRRHGLFLLLDWRNRGLGTASVAFAPQKPKTRRPWAPR